MDTKRYLRLHTYGVYANYGWASANPNLSVSVGALNGASDHEAIWEKSLDEIKNPEQVPFTVTVLDPAVAGIPVPGEISEKKPTKLNPVGADVPAQSNHDGTFNVGSINPGDPIPTYTGVTNVPPEPVNPRDAERDLPTSMESYLDTEDTTIPPAVRDLALQVTAGKKTDFDKAEAIQHEIERRCLYNLKAPRTPAGDDPVQYFLFSSHEGYCDLFASSMTLMARSVGIPSRYVTGFYPIKGTKPPGHEHDPNTWSISESESHAWCELFFKDVGWIAFDATEGAQYAPGEGRGDPTAGAAWYKSAAVKNILDGAIFVVLIGGGLFAFMNFRKYTRDRVPSREDVGKEYARFTGLLQKLSGRRRLPSQTPNEYLDVTRKALGTHAPTAERINGKFVEALYSPTVISEGILTQLRADTEELRQELRANGNGKSGKPPAGSTK
jgi:transglutaminase-like putative cysteine protease